MGWFTSDEGETEGTSNNSGNGVMATLGASAKWIWDNAIVGVFTYTANTAFQLFEQGLALREAVPTLVKNPEAQRIVRGMAHVLVYDVLPLVSLNAINNQLQSYFQEDQEEVTGLSPYSVFLTGLTLVNYTVVAFTWRQGAQASVRILLLDSLGPPAFNSNKTIRPPSLCTELNCTVKREVKGWAREPFVLIGNDLLTAGINYIPYVGPPVSRVLSVYFIGRYITRLTTPERCERHKAMMQESVLALGLSYEATTLIMDMFLEATVGMPPFLYYRVMRHLLLLLHVNVAAHMTLPLVLPKDATVYMDPLNLYERISRFIADVIFSGLKDRIPKDFKLEEGAKPLIPLSTGLKFTTKVLRSDLESERVLTQPGFFKRSANTIKPWVLPPMFRDATSFVNDAVVAEHWRDLREGAIAVVEIMGSVGKVNVVPVTTAIKEIVQQMFSKSKGETLAKTAVLTASWTPEFTAKALNYKWGIPKSLTRVTLKLSKKEDFWELADELQAWLERHNIPFKVTLVESSQVPLLGEKKVAPFPEHVESPPIPSHQLISGRRTSLDFQTSSADELISDRRVSLKTKTSELHIEELKSDPHLSEECETSVISADKLIPQRRSRLKSSDMDTGIVELHTSKSEIPIISSEEEVVPRKKYPVFTQVANPESLFTTRKRNVPSTQSGVVPVIIDAEVINNAYI